MAGDAFDESRLDDPAALARADAALRHIAEGGARVRREAEASAAALPTGTDIGRPRAVVAAGADARLLRAVLEPWCPVPFVAWPGPGLPGWVGSLDLVVVMAPRATDTDAATAVATAERRGSSLVLACPGDAPLAAVLPRGAWLLPTQTDDTLAIAVVVLQALHALGLGPTVSAAEVADALDGVALRCGPRYELGSNPAKDAALVLADALPLVWGGSVLAARAARRIVEALRRSCGRPALAADARHLSPVLAATPRRDPFADPFEAAVTGLAEAFATTPAGFGGPSGPGAGPALRPALIVVDDGATEPAVLATEGELAELAEAHDVRVVRLTWADGAEVARYAALVAYGSYVAAYLGVGLARPAG